MPTDLDTAKSEFQSALPDWWYVVEESETEMMVTLGPNNFAPGEREAYTYRIMRPASEAEALRHAMKQALAH
jgi:hypothetical protein